VRCLWIQTIRLQTRKFVYQAKASIPMWVWGIATLAALAFAGFILRNRIADAVLGLKSTEP